MTDETSNPDKVPAQPSIPEQIAQALGGEIMAGRRKPGERLVELDLARELSVNRALLREALHILERQHLVDLQARRGAYVRPLSLKWITDLFNVLIALSLYAVREMATAPVESYIDTLERRADELSDMIDNPDPVAFALSMTKTVQLIARGSGNEVLDETLLNLANHSVWSTMWKAPLDYRTRHIRRETARQMKRVVEAIRRHDCNAAVVNLGQVLEDDRNRAIASLAELRQQTEEMAALASLRQAAREMAARESMPVKEVSAKHR
ncbi:MAG: GntR family transcriptional regulator [Alphaproteobacteria bacterium]|nr:GntR family transcriptional regulator [Alphaproteobacteria bacterium]